MRKSVQKTVLDRITPKVAPNPVSKNENCALRPFSRVPVGGLNAAKNVKKRHQKKKSRVATQFTRNCNGLDHHFEEFWGARLTRRSATKKLKTESLA